MLQVLILPLFLGTLPFMPTPSHPNPRTSPGTHSRRPDGGGRRTSAPARPPSAGLWLADHAALACLFGLLVLALLAEMPWLSRPVRSHLLQAAVVLVYTLIAAFGPASGRLPLLRPVLGADIYRISLALFVREL